ncbi:hypothetical protein R50072_36880 [Simiduia litorea]|uniref:hypothetical protein n=1 Tax=Simiduia litorea TaxID=1435348 RepID=UPI0036F352CB
MLSLIGVILIVVTVISALLGLPFVLAKVTEWELKQDHWYSILQKYKHERGFRLTSYQQISVIPIFVYLVFVVDEKILSDRQLENFSIIFCASLLFFLWSFWRYLNGGNKFYKSSLIIILALFFLVSLVYFKVASSLFAMFYGVPLSIYWGTVLLTRKALRLKNA